LRTASLPKLPRDRVLFGMALEDVIKTTVQKADELRSAGAGGNEANTKALLIEPMLHALSWDTTDLTQVEREHRVFDGTALDYALKIEGEPRLFVEAKGVTKSLDDRQFIAQAINYANNEGVLWCVLTNGIAYRVYKTNEPVGMEQKLLFEVDLAEATDGDVDDIAQSLNLISRDALVDGELDLWGERVFTDTRVRQALATLGGDPPRGFLRAVEETVGQPSVPRDRLKESLARVLDAQQVSRSPRLGPRPVHKPRPTSAARGRGRADRKEYDVSHHMKGIPTGIVDFFEQLDEFARGLGPDVTRRIRKQYVGYFGGEKGKSFCTMETQRRRIIVYLSLDPTEAKPWNDSLMRDVREIGHFGMGDTEYSVRQATHLDDAKALIRNAYERVSA
jgi:predicted transport protein